MSKCEHGKRISRCVDCGGSEICEHKKIKSRCVECGGCSICEHKKRKDHCKECGNSYCKHGREKTTCVTCDGSMFCKHKKNKYRCKECDGRSLCKSTWCEVRGIPKYGGYCLNCCVQFRPDINVARNYKTKENEVVKCVKEAFPDYTWVHDKRIGGGCSRRRPDLLLDLGTHIIIVEVDENKHDDYDCSCENKRLMEISMDLGHRPVVFIRFNPDEYTNIEGKTVKSCWRTNKLGLMSVMKSKQTEWEERICSLKTQINYFIENVTTKTVEIIELFY